MEIKRIEQIVKDWDGRFKELGLIHGIAARDPATRRIVGFAYAQDPTVATIPNPIGLQLFISDMTFVRLYATDRMSMQAMIKYVTERYGRPGAPIPRVIDLTAGKGPAEPPGMMKA